MNYTENNRIEYKEQLNDDFEQAKILGVSREKIKYNIAILKVNNILERIGSNKIGEWKILK